MILCLKNKKDGNILNLENKIDQIVYKLYGLATYTDRRVGLSGFFRESYSIILEATI